MARTATHEPTVPLAEMGYGSMDLETARAYGAIAGVEVVVDFADRPSVSLDDAYRLAEWRRKVDREQSEAESRRHTEHRAAVEKLQARMNEAFVQARDEYMERMVDKPSFGPGETRGEAVNAGLAAARLLWFAADGTVRQEVTRVTGLEADTWMTYDIGTTLPRPIVDGYIRKAAKKA